MPEEIDRIEHLIGAARFLEDIISQASQSAEYKWEKHFQHSYGIRPRTAPIPARANVTNCCGILRAGGCNTEASTLEELFLRLQFETEAFNRGEENDRRRIAAACDLGRNAISLFESLTARAGLSYLRIREKRAIDPGSTNSASAGDKSKLSQSDLDNESRAIAVLVKNPGWSVSRIAEEVGVKRNTPYKWRRFNEARNAIRETQRSAVPRGSKNGKTGEVEAWLDDE